MDDELMGAADDVAAETEEIAEEGASEILEASAVTGAEASDLLVESAED